MGSGLLSQAHYETASAKGILLLQLWRLFAVFQVGFQGSGTLANAAFIGEFVEHGVG